MSHDLVKDAPNAWPSYALDAPALMARNAPLASEDVVIGSIEPPSAAAEAFDLVVDIAGVEIGECTRLAEALGVEGAAELNESAFSSDGLTVSISRTADGEVFSRPFRDGGKAGWAASDNRDGVRPSPIPRRREEDGCLFLVPACRPGSSDPVRAEGGVVGEGGAGAVR